jgi:glycolate oxidase iron-sulfur subunit
MTKPDLSAADLCVMCGMCHPYCPTYLTNKTETESPRGRLSMILGLANGTLTADKSVISHLDNCTRCGACEAMCPSRVPVIQLMDNSKQLIAQQQHQPLILKTLLWLTAQPKRYHLIALLFKNKLLGFLFRLAGLLHKDTRYLQAVTKTGPGFKDFYPAKGDVTGNIGLFTGCLTGTFDTQTLHDTITLLTHGGYNVYLPREQVCCGALHQHNGQIETADKLTTINQSTFQANTIDAIIGTSTGCTSQLSQRLTNLKVLDIMQFIQQTKLLDKLQLGEITQSALLHSPCSQRNILKQTSWLALLRTIPGLDIAELKDNQLCCGAGGSNLLTTPVSAAALRAPKLTHIQESCPDYVISTNYGCALHLAAGLKQMNILSQNKQIEVLHPVSLLVRSASLK